LGLLSSAATKSNVQSTLGPRSPLEKRDPMDFQDRGLSCPLKPVVRLCKVQGSSGF